MCQASGEWHLVGVAAWRRKGCSATAQRPRVYDKVALNSEWARKTMTQMEDDRKRIPKRKVEDGNG